MRMVSIARRPFLSIALGFSVLAWSSPPRPAASAAGATLPARIEATPRFPLRASRLDIVAPDGRRAGMVSWVARDPANDSLWILQRGSGLEPVLNVNAKGVVLHAFGRGAFKIPHAIRIDPEGHVWTVDAGSSQVIEWSEQGDRLRTLNLGGTNPAPEGGFGGATDVAFGPEGRIFVSDGYVRARVVEFDRTGTKLGEWGTAGQGEGQFHLPHSIAVSAQGTVYVADRENGRIEEFDERGRYLGQIAGLGRTYALAMGTDGVLWASMQPMDEPPGAAGWIVAFEPRSGRMLGYVPVTEKGGLHGLALDRDNHPITDLGDGVLWFRSDVRETRPVR